MSVADIETAIIQLPPDKLAYLKDWITRIPATSNPDAQDPLLQLLGSIDADVNDVAQRHDEYLGQQLRPDTRNNG